MHPRKEPGRFFEKIPIRISRWTIEEFVHNFAEEFLTNRQKKPCDNLWKNLWRNSLENFSKNQWRCLWRNLQEDFQSNLWRNNWGNSWKVFLLILEENSCGISSGISEGNWFRSGILEGNSGGIAEEIFR